MKHPFQKAILMYHSVAGDTPAVPGSHPISMERFRNQIETLLQQGWENAPLSRLREPVDRPTFYITADDGTVDWSRNVLPWCEQRGLHTHTAVITGPWESPPRYPLAHLVQVALVLRPAGELQSLAERIAGRLGRGQRDYIDKAYHYETDPMRRIIKGACNLILPENEARHLLHLPRDLEEEALESRFEDAGYYRRFRLAEVGAHTVTHRTLDRNTEQYVREEIEPCLQALRQKGLTPSSFFTNPMTPAPGAAVEDLTPWLRQMGFAGTLTCCGEWDQQGFVVPRIDAQRIEHYFGMESHPA